MRNTLKGYTCGIIAAVSYGTNPLFALPLYAVGLSVMSVLFYRYAFATVILGLIMWLRGDSFRLAKGEWGAMVVMGILFALSSVFLFDSYSYMDVGIASTLLFMQPVFIALILWLVFHERIGWLTILSIAVCLVGVGFLCNPGPGAVVTSMGVILVMLSGLSYAIYMVAINKSRVEHLSNTRITFYSLLFGQIVFCACTKGFTEIQALPVHDLTAMACVIGLSVIPTIVSLMTVAISIKSVGSVTVAILGALEPVTGVVIGTLVFGEVLTIRVMIGIVLILTSVTALILSRSKSKSLTPCP